jgi:hypothetical protein
LYFTISTCNAIRNSRSNEKQYLSVEYAIRHHRLDTTLVCLLIYLVAHSTTSTMRKRRHDFAATVRTHVCCFASASFGAGTSTHTMTVRAFANVRSLPPSSSPKLHALVINDRSAVESPTTMRGFLCFPSQLRTHSSTQNQPSILIHPHLVSVHGAIDHHGSVVSSYHSQHNAVLMILHGRFPCGVQPAATLSLS